VLVLFCRDDQLGSGKTQSLTVGDAVRNGMVNNETLAYFMARTQLFLEKVRTAYVITITTTATLD
jgi:glycyl-tRNA synthetase